MLELLTIDNCNSVDIPIPSALQPAYELFQFTDVATNETFCVLMETQDDDNNGKADNG